MKIKFTKAFQTWAIYGRETGEDGFVAPLDVKKNDIFHVDPPTNDVFHLTEDIMLGKKLEFISKEIWEIVEN